MTKQLDTETTRDDDFIDLGEASIETEGSPNFNDVEGVGSLIYKD